VKKGHRSRRRSAREGAPLVVVKEGVKEGVAQVCSASLSVLFASLVKARRS
jgi:hypothetical protein